MNTRQILRRMYWVSCTQFGFDPRRLIRGLRGLNRFQQELRSFRHHFHGRCEIVPCLHDWQGEAASIRNEYFWQDLLVAQRVYLARPRRHVDIGSRLDGFIAHVASFREIEVLDVRPLNLRIPNVTFRQADLMSPQLQLSDYCDSLSCLHALEHFGLGRYGDPICANGFRLGLANMGKMLKFNGKFYLAVPVGQPRVEFNANMVFHPRDILEAAAAAGLTPQRLTMIAPDGMASDIILSEDAIADWGERRYNLGLFEMRKGNSSAR